MHELIKGHNAPLSFFSDSNQLGSRFKAYSSRIMQTTILELLTYGITEKFIRKNWQPSEVTSDWTQFEKDALIFLVTGQPPEPLIMQDYTVAPLPKHLRLKPEEALQEMTRLCDDQLKALIRFYHKGLRGEQLRKWRGKSLSGFNVFTHHYYLALETLIDKKNLTPKKAIQLITDIDSKTATKMWLNVDYAKAEPSFKFEKQQKLAKLRLRNHYLPESFSVNLLNLHDKEGNLLGIYESGYNDLKDYLKKQGKKVEQLSSDEWYKAIYESKVNVIKYLNPQILKSYELDAKNSDLKNGKIITKAGFQLCNDSRQNLIIIKDHKIYVSPKVRPIPGDVSPTQAFKCLDEEPGLVGICHSSLTGGEIVEFAGSLFYNKEIGWIMEATTGHYGTRPFQLKFLLEKLQEVNIPLQDLFIKIIVPKNLKDRNEGYDEAIVNAAVLLTQILNSQVRIHLSHQQHLIPYVLSLEKYVMQNEKYQQFISDFEKVPQKLLLSLQELNRNTEFLQLKNKNFPRDQQELIVLRDRIWDSIYPLFKTVQIASLLKTCHDLQKISYEKITKVCERLFVDIIDDLIKDKILPKIVCTPDTRILFWSSDLGKEASNTHARQNQSLNDVIALKYPGRILAGWRSEDLSSEYKKQYGDKLNVLFDLLDHRKKTPYEDLKKFFWDSYSCIHTSLVLDTSSDSLLFAQDSLTDDNFFMNTELDILRKNNKKIMIQEISKTLEKLEINIEGEPLLSEKINHFKEKFQTIINISSSQINIIFHDDLNRPKGFIQITKNKLLKDCKIEKIYFIKINLDSDETSVYFLGKEASKKLINLFIPKWNGIFKEEKSIDLYTHMRPRIPVPDLPTKTRSIYLSDIACVKEGVKLFPRQDEKRTNQLFVSTEAPMLHSWLCAYIQAIKEKKRPVFDPIYFTKAFHLEYLACDSNDSSRQKNLNLFFTMIIKNLKLIRSQVLFSEERETQPAILWEAFKCILIDAKQGSEHLSRTLKELKPSIKNKVYFLTVLNAFLKEANEKIVSYNNAEKERGQVPSNYRF